MRQTEARGFLRQTCGDKNASERCPPAPPGGGAPPPSPTPPPPPPHPLPHARAAAAEIGHAALTWHGKLLCGYNPLHVLGAGGRGQGAWQKVVAVGKVSAR
jgi:hypothetical protein